MAAVQPPTESRTTPPQRPVRKTSTPSFRATPVPGALPGRDGADGYLPPLAQLYAPNVSSPNAPTVPPGRDPARDTARDGGGGREVRGDEIAMLYRKVTALLSERAEAEARVERALNESAAADEQVGQMLASIAAIEGRLRASQREAAAAEERARTAEQRVTELSALVAKTRAAEAAGDERVTAAEARTAERERERDQLRVALESMQRDADKSRAGSDQVRAELTKATAHAAELVLEAARMADERDAMRAIIEDLEGIAEERDEALARVELAEVHVRNSRKELDKAREIALTGENRLEGALRDRVTEIDRVAGELAEERNRTAALEKELAAAQRALEEQTAAAAREADKVLAAKETDAKAARQRQLELEKEAALVRGERDANATRAGEHEARAAALRTELDGVRTVLDATRSKLKTLAIEREMAEGLSNQARAAHEAEAKRLRDEATEATARSTEAMAMAEQFRSEMAAARRERDAAAAQAGRSKRDLEQFKSRAEPLRTEFRSAVDEASRGLADLEKRELEVTRLRSSAIASTRELLDRAVAVEHALAAMLREVEQAPARSSLTPPPASGGIGSTPGSAPPSSSPTSRRSKSTA